MSHWLFFFHKLKGKIMNILQEVRRTADAGIEPLKITYSSIKSCSGEGTLGYRAVITVNSLQLGTLAQNEYTPISDSNETGVRLAEWIIIRVAKEIKKIIKDETKNIFVSVHCPVHIA